MKKLTAHLCLYMALMGLFACQERVATSNTYAEEDLQDNLTSVLEDAASASEATGSVDIIEDVVVRPNPTDPCIQCSWYFCPLMDYVYQKEFCFDICEDPPVVLWETECVEFLECDPMQYLLDVIECTTEEGYPGTQQTVCDKGHILNLECETECFEEICDYLDNDCDGVADNGVINVCGECGPVPEEICNYIDDNCDGVIDEGLRNACGDCGDAPEETCNYIDDDCDGVIDNGVANACGECGSLDEEICDYIDNNCDGQVDEAQRNVCDECGLVPQEICDGLDNNCNGYIDEGLVQPCATVCDTGYELCIGGDWISCNATAPEEEICNGYDDDCDGMTDEGLYCQCPPELIGALIECVSPPLTCGKGFKTCECANDDCTENYMTDCAALCVYVPVEGETCEPTLGIPVNEQCNNYDDDCDEFIDEDLYASCYTGPEGTENVGICKGGLQYCDSGTWGADNEYGEYHIGFCDGEITPKDEDICNNADDDCDGIVDKGLPMDPTDILFIIDWSGSMTDEIDAVIEALTIFSSYYADEGVLRWGLAIGPVRDPDACTGVTCPLPEVCYEGNCYECGSGNDMLDACNVFPVGTPCYEALCKPSFSYWQTVSEELKLLADFSSFDVFVGALTAAKADQMFNTGNEMLLDALFLAINNISIPVVDIFLYEWVTVFPIESSPDLHNFQFNWREDAEKLIVIFSDELPQSYLDPQVTGSEVATMMASIPNLKPYVFSISSSNWSTITNANGGGWYFLQPDTFAMLANLLEILDENVCE